MDWKADYRQKPYLSIFLPYQTHNELSLHSLTHTHHPNMAHAIVLCECMNSKGIGNGNTDKVSFEGVSVQAFVDGTGTKEGLNA